MFEAKLVPLMWLNNANEIKGKGNLDPEKDIIPQPPSLELIRKTMNNVDLE